MHSIFSAVTLLLFLKDTEKENMAKSMASNLAGCRLNTCARSYLVNNTADSYSNYAIDWLGGELY